ncbi:DNA polymerase Y family protein [Cellulomonas fimi]|uniref:DNA polymerase Y family protein n=1 Tax=Cellulomonas fimi TaxID=1708 RepID=UPI00234DE913|nr:DNA polymerase Y family protein [Cellulomonas fimi]MDC7121382.1 DNA polymerase Y family protein [Cellulomonas fimi]
MSTRTTVLWVPDWPVVAATTADEVPAHLPAAVHDGRRVTAVSALARVEGVRRGMRRRQAQGCCPELVLLPADDVRDVRLFEPVASAAETVVAGIEVVRAGLLLLPAGGASRYHGSEDVLAERLVDAVAAHAGHECAVGTADGLLAAVVAARTGAVVPPGSSPAFLAQRGVTELVHAAVTEDAAQQVADLVDLLHRLGLRTLGQLAALPTGDVHARFGRLGVWAQTLARGDDERPPARRRPEADLEVVAELDPPVDRVDTATFAGRRLAEDLHAQLVHRSVTCGRMQIAARTDDGTDLVRTWRTDLGGFGGLTPQRITDRIRWQLESWLSSTAVATARSRAQDAPERVRAARARAARARAARDGAQDPWAFDDLVDEPWVDDDVRPVTLVRLAVTALDVAPAGAEQGRLWGGPSGGDLRAHRALDRVQGIVGGQGVLTATLQGGRGVRDQVHLQPWGEQTQAARAADLPWPGRLPDPAPATVLARPLPVDVRDAAGRPVVLDVRVGLRGEPATVRWPVASDTDASSVARASARTTGTGGFPSPRGRSPAEGFLASDGWPSGGAWSAGRVTSDGRDEPVRVRERAVAGWAGPWLSSERWWGTGGRVGVRGHLQVAFDDGDAVLLAGDADGWTCEATYD